MKIICLPIAILILFVCGSCSNTLTIPSLESVPAISSGKARVVHIFDDSPNMWKITPFYISVDGRPVERVNLKKFTYIDVNSGTRVLSYDQHKAIGLRDGMSLSFLPGQTRYLYVKSRYRPDRSGVYIDGFQLDVSEITAAEAQFILLKP